MIKGAKYRIKKMESAESSGVYVGENERDLQVFAVGRGWETYLEKKDIFFVTQVSSPLSSNKIKLALSKFLDPCDPIFKQQLIHMEQSGNNLFIYTEESCVPEQRIATPQSVPIKDLEMGATYLFEGKHSGLINSGVFVGTEMDSSVCCFVAHGSWDCYQSDDIAVVYKVKDVSYIDLGAEYEEEQVPIAMIKGVRHWKVFYPGKDGSQEVNYVNYQISDSNPVGIHWAPLTEEMYWGSASDPYEHKLRSGDQICSKEYPDITIFIDRVYSDHVTLVTSSKNVLWDSIVGAVPSFDQFMGLGEGGWNYVPRENHRQYNLASLYDIVDEFQRNYMVSRMAEEDVLHIELLDSGFIHIYDLYDGQLRRQTFVRRHPCLTNQGGYILFIDKGWIRPFNLGVLYTVTLQDGSSFRGRYKKETEAGLIFCHEETGVRHILPPNLIEKIQVSGPALKDKTGEYVILREARGGCLCAKYIEEDQAVQPVIEQEWFLEEEEDKALLCGF